MILNPKRIIIEEIHGEKSRKSVKTRISPGVQWLRLCFQMWGVQAHSLGGERRSHPPCQVPAPPHPCKKRKILGEVLAGIVVFGPNTGSMGLPCWLLVRNLPTMQETQFRSLGQEDPGEGNGNPLQYSCLENPMDEEPGRLQSMGSQSRTRL